MGDVATAPTTPAAPTTPEWSEAERRLFALNRLRATAQKALEQRYADPWSPALEELLDSLIFDVYEADKAYRATAAGRS